MDQLTSPENKHLAGYLDLLMEHGREYAQRAGAARSGTEPGVPTADQRHEHVHPCDLYAWRYLCP